MKRSGPFSFCIPWDHIIADDNFCLHSMLLYTVSGSSQLQCWELMFGGVMEIVVEGAFWTWKVTKAHNDYSGNILCSVFSP